MKKNLSSWSFLAALLVFLILFDCGLAFFGEQVWPYAYNDYEVTRRDHPEAVWERVFFGNSAVISAYREEQSEADYVNLGMDYAVVTDLWDLLRKGHLKVGSELVIGLNLFTLYDDFDTNPAYLWHRGTLEPYAYFHRDKLMQIARDVQKLCRGGSVYKGGKYLYYGSLPQAELQEKLDKYEQSYFCLPIADFQENLRALDSLAAWCAVNGVRLRLLWMPFHPGVKRPALLQELRQTVNAWCRDRQIILNDMTDALSEACFHDVGHLNDETGANEFTEVVDPWLLS